MDISTYDACMQELGIDNYFSIASRLDLLLISKDRKVKINIEINKNKSKALLNKNKTYACKIAGNFYNDLDIKYKDDIKVIQINLNAYKSSCEGVFLNRFYFYDKEYEVEDKSIEIYQVYLPNYKDNSYDISREEYNDYALLMCKSYKEMEDYIKNNSEREAFVRDMKAMSSQEAFANLIDYDEFEEALRRERQEELETIRKELENEKNEEIYEAKKEAIELGRKEGIEVGRKEGIEAGRKEGIEAGRKEGIEAGRKEGMEVGRKEGMDIAKKEIVLEMVRSLIKNNVDISIISSSLNISVDEINNIYKASI